MSINNPLGLPDWSHENPDHTPYEDDEDFDEDWEDDQCFECGEIGEDCTCEDDGWIE